MIFLVRFTCEFLVSVLTIKSHVSGYIFWVIWYICRRLKCSSFQTQMFNSDVIFDQLLVKDFFTEGTDFFPCLLLMVGCRKQTDPNALGCNVRNGLMSFQMMLFLETFWALRTIEFSSIIDFIYISKYFLSDLPSCTDLGSDHVIPVSPKLCWFQMSFASHLGLIALLVDASWMNVQKWIVCHIFHKRIWGKGEQYIDEFSGQIHLWISLHSPYNQ